MSKATLDAQESAIRTLLTYRNGNHSPQNNRILDLLIEAGELIRTEEAEFAQWLKDHPNENYYGIH